MLSLSAYKLIKAPSDPAASHSTPILQQHYGSALAVYSTPAYRQLLSIKPYAAHQLVNSAHQSTTQQLRAVHQRRYAIQQQITIQQPPYTCRRPVTEVSLSTGGYQVVPSIAASYNPTASSSTPALQQLNSLAQYPISKHPAALSQHANNYLAAIAAPTTQ